METEKREKKLSKNELEILKTLASWGPLSAYEIYKKINKRIDYSTVRKILKDLESKKYVAKQESEGKIERKKVLYKLTLPGLANAVLKGVIHSTRPDLFEYVSSIINNWKEFDDVIFTNWKDIAEVFSKEKAITALQQYLSDVASPAPFILKRTVLRWPNFPAQHSQEPLVVFDSYEEEKEFARRQFFFNLFELYSDYSSDSLEELAAKIKKVPGIQSFIVSYFEKDKTYYFKRYNYYSSLLQLIKKE
jgi:predicted transcriptional regulator